MKKLAMFDIDGVIYEGHSIFDQIQDQEKRGILEAGTWDKILFELTEYKSGRKNYTQAANSMLEVSAMSIKGKSLNMILDDTFNYLLKNKDKFFPYFEKLVNMIKGDYDIYLVTTNFQVMPEAIQKIFDLESKYISSTAEVTDGKFTGKVSLSLAGNKGIVSKLVKKYGKKGSIAVGDSENDADMLNLVDFPIVMEPNPKLTVIAKENNWQIVDRDTIAGIIIEHAK